MIGPKEIPVVLAAGGHAQRLGGGPPKALLNIAGKSLLFWTVQEFARVGFRQFIIFSNRPEFNAEIICIMRGFGRVILINDSGVDSTLSLAEQGAFQVPAHRVCFAYGHAPRPAHHIRRLWSQQTDIAATLVSTSSKLHPLPWGSGYIEPPVFVNRAEFLTAPVKDWASFLEHRHSKVAAVPVTGPSEANTKAELQHYGRYVRMRMAVAIHGRECPLSVVMPSS